MSTRANIIIKDSYGERLIFYRHSDGYPEGTLPTLEKFLSWVKEGRIRDNAEQAAGWLIILGHTEYNGKPEPDFISGWKVGAYEPATCIHGDIEYLYIIDLSKKTIETKKIE
jgi:hypothetical protein